jgi:hypothetical protein
MNSDLGWVFFSSVSMRPCLLVITLVLNVRICFSSDVSLSLGLVV